jgi:hypothetical protein
VNGAFRIEPDPERGYFSPTFLPLSYARGSGGHYDFPRVPTIDGDVPAYRFSGGCAGRGISGGRAGRGISGGFGGRGISGCGRCGGGVVGLLAMIFSLL